MPNDVKKGMLIGLVLVTGIGLLLVIKNPSINTNQLPQSEPNTAAAAEKISDTGIENLSRPTSPGPNEPAGPPEKIKTTRFHIVTQGQNLSGISEIYYGDPGRWQKILNANKEKLPNPNNLRPGTKLIIPD